MNLLLEEFIIDLPYDVFDPKEIAIDLAREESPTWSSHCIWDVWEIESDLMLFSCYCVTKVSLLP